MIDPAEGRELPATIAIDGPAGSGKSTVARLLADRIGGARLDTGAMYRSVAWAALHRQVDIHGTDTVSELARALTVEVAGDRTWVDGTEVTEAIRTPEVDAAVSAIAANAGVRAELVDRQRRWAASHHRPVVEGRDIGSVVLPDADLKLYLTASVAERARRRSRQRHLTDAGAEAEVAEQLARRDLQDSTRSHSPLPAAHEVAGDALVIDTTDVAPEAIVEQALAWWHHRARSLHDGAGDHR